MGVNVDHDKANARTQSPAAIASAAALGLNVFTPEMYSTAPTGVHVQQAIDAATAAGGSVLAQGTYTSAALITVTCPCDMSRATISCSDPTLPVQVKVKSASALESGAPAYLRGARILLPRVVAAFASESAWSGRGTGVQVVNLIECDVYFHEVSGFATGIHIAASGGTGADGLRACSWNKFHYGLVTNNKVNLLVDPLDTYAFANENTHWGGRFCHQTPVTTTGIAGCYHHKIGKTGSGANSQRFFGASIEGENVEAHIYCEDGYSTWDGVRGEHYNLAAMVIKFVGSSARYNKVFASPAFGAPTITETGGANYNHVDTEAQRRRAGSSSVAVEVLNNATGNPVVAAVGSGTSPHAATYADLISALSEEGFWTKTSGDTLPRLMARYDGQLRWSNGTDAADVIASRVLPGVLAFTSGKVTANDGLGVGNSVSASSVSTVVKAVQIFDLSGNALGWVPIYSSKT